MMATIEKCHLCSREYKWQSPLHKCQICGKEVCGLCKIKVNDNYCWVCPGSCENEAKKRIVK